VCSPWLPLRWGDWGLGHVRWDPLRPDGTYFLDLSVPDERQIAIHLVRLAVVEPGTWPSTAHRLCCKLGEGSDVFGSGVSFVFSAVQR